MKLVQKENSEPKIKPVIENLQNELYQLENKQAKGAKLCANIRQELGVKKAPKHSSEYLKDRICKFKQYFNYILMIINQTILRKNYTKQTSTAATTEFPSKIPNIKKTSNEHFNLC